jgi:hypothetical protein
MQRAKRVVLRDLMIFQLKLVIDGLKDIVLSPLSIAAAAADIVFPGRRVGHRFYFVMSVAEKFDRWLNVFGAAEQADASRDGLFGASRAGSATLLGRLERIVLGHDEPGDDSPSGDARFRNAA